ncbi:LysR family transcriptional regulator [Gordonibacter sp. An230]|uniref:LysR family transcriptional regulator n=1 Tax=Gordonibacter sp. An230 TaxID=1965592 RepID=UPI000B39459A|nr:LysR family transcriptional regulator [Gordonibacter sp. An230]OUO90163.1 LysR family transcriptional regulator [Gordonibacter sp. An230]
MTLQQLRYLIAIAEHGSINAAAQNLYASQSNLSTAMKELERELGITVFTRSNRGVTLTNDGTELLGYARQVIEQADMLEARYADKGAAHLRLAVSTQHYAFSVQAFVNVVEACEGEEYEFVLREATTAEIIDDVRAFRSEVGILYTDDFNRRVLRKAFDDADVTYSPLFDARVHVFVGEHHPLADRTLIKPEDLEPYPRYSFEQGATNSFYYSEEPLAHLPHKRNIRISDRGTLTNLLTSYNGFTLSTGVLSAEMHSGIASIPLAVDETMQVGYLMHNERRPSPLLLRYIDELHAVIKANPTVVAHRHSSPAL